MLTGYLIGDKETVANITSLRPRLRAALEKTVEKLALQLLRHVKSDKLSGDVLGTVTGRLRRSINKRLWHTRDGIFASVGTNVEYAHVHEYGFNGVVNVKEHLRNTVNGPVNVRAHIMRMKMPPRSFLRSSLKDMEPTIKQQLQAAMTGAARETLA